MMSGSIRGPLVMLLELFLICLLLATRPTLCERIFEESASVTAESHHAGHHLFKKNVRGGKLSHQLSEPSRTTPAAAAAAKQPQVGVVSASSSLIAQQQQQQKHPSSQNERMLAGYVLDLEMTFYYQVGFGYILREPTEEEYEGLRVATLDYIKTSTENYYEDKEEDFSLQNVYVTLKETEYDPNVAPDTSGNVYPYIVTMDVFIVFDADAYSSIPTKPTFVQIMTQEFNLMQYLMLHLGGVNPNTSLFRFTYRVKYGVYYDNPLPGLLAPSTPPPTPTLAPSISAPPTPLPPPTVLTTTSLWKYQIGYGVAARQPSDEEYTALASTTQSFLEVELQDYYNTPDMPVPFLEEVQVKILQADFFDLSPDNNNATSADDSSGAGQSPNGGFPIEVIYQIELFFDSTGQSGGGTPPTSISIIDLIVDGTLDANEYTQTYLPSIQIPQFNIFTFVPRVLFSTVDNDDGSGSDSTQDNVVLEEHNMTVTIQSNWSFGVTNPSSFYSPTPQEYYGLLTATQAYLNDLFLFYYVPVSSAVDVIFQFDGDIESKLDFTTFDRNDDYPIQMVIESNLTFLRDPQHVMIPESYQVYPAFDNVDLEDYFDNYLQHHILNSPLYNRRSILRAITNVQYTYDSAFFNVFIPDEYLNPPTMAPIPNDDDGSLQPSMDTTGDDADMIDPSWTKMQLVTNLRFQINQDRPDRQPTDEEYDGLLDEIEKFYKVSFDDYFDASDNQSSEFMHLEADFISTLYEPKLAEDGVTVIRDDLSYFPHQTQVQLDLYFTPESVLQRDFEYVAILTLFDYGTFIRDYVWKAEPSSNVFRGTSQVGYNPYAT